MDQRVYEISVQHSSHKMTFHFIYKMFLKNLKEKCALAFTINIPALLCLLCPCLFNTVPVLYGRDMQGWKKVLWFSPNFQKHTSRKSTDTCDMWTSDHHTKFPKPWSLWLSLFQFTVTTVSTCLRRLSIRFLAIQPQETVPLKPSLMHCHDATDLERLVPVKGNLNATIQSHLIKLCADNFVTKVWVRPTYWWDANVYEYFWPFVFRNLFWAFLCCDFLESLLFMYEFMCFHFYVSGTK